MSSDTAPEVDPPRRTVTLRINGRPRSAQCDDSTLLVHFVRDDLGLKGTHAACLNGDCGVCTLQLDGHLVKSCLILAPAADGSDVHTVDGLGTPDRLSVLQEEFWRHDAIQCGFCTPGFLMAALDLIDRSAAHTEADVRQGLAGNLCRCTGYQKIVDAVLAAARRMAVDDASATADDDQLPFAPHP